MALARVAVERIDVSVHAGVHPRLGAVDVVPFVPLDDPTADGLAAAATSPEPGESGRRRSSGCRSSSTERRTLRGARCLTCGGRPFGSGRPDFGPSEPHPTAGAMAVGARPVLVAVNCELAAGVGGLEDDLAVARAVAREVRERDGGLPGVRALGFALASKSRAQVSMNLIDLAATGVEAACEAVRRGVAERGGEVSGGGVGGASPRRRTRAVQRGVPRLERAVFRPDDRSPARRAVSLRVPPQTDGACSG